MYVQGSRRIFQDERTDEVWESGIEPAYPDGTALERVKTIVIIGIPNSESFFYLFQRARNKC